MADHREDDPVTEARPIDFATFYRNTSAEVFRTLCVVLRDVGLAQEAMDEAMTRAFERWSKVSSYENPKGWVYRVAVNWARSRLRARRREVLTDVEPPPFFDPVSDPDFDRAVSDLPLRYREVVVFRFVFDLSQDQIAEALGIPVGTVKSRLNRALERLRREVSEID